MPASLSGITHHSHPLRCLDLKGHCHGDFAVFWSKMFKYLTKNLFCNIKSLSQHLNENIKRFFSKEEQTIFQVAIHLHGSHPQPIIIYSSFCELKGLLLTKPNHSIETNSFFIYSQ